MSEFRPFHTAHAIEKCAVNVSFDGSLPEKLYSRYIDEIASDLNSFQFRRGANLGAFKVDATTGQSLPVDNDYSPVNFNNTDNSIELVIFPNGIIFTTHRYVRWATFIEAFKLITSTVLDRFETAVNIGSVGLEYWDRFIWTGGWDDFDLRKLVRDDTAIICGKVFSSERETHSHVGWFEYSSGVRRLYNVNLDVLAYGSGHNPMHLDPSVGIYILVNDQSENLKVKEFADVNLINRLESLHKASKDQFTNILRAEWAERIGIGG